jgi:hypothetical protein
MGLTAFNSLRRSQEAQTARVADEIAESLAKETEVKPDVSNDNSNRKRVNKQQLPDVS